MAFVSDVEPLAPTSEIETRRLKASRRSKYHIGGDNKARAKELLSPENNMGWLGTFNPNCLPSFRFVPFCTTVFNSVE